MDEYPEKIPEQPEPNSELVERLKDTLRPFSLETKEWLLEKVTDSQAREVVEDAEEILRQGE